MQPFALLGNLLGGENGGHHQNVEVVEAQGPEDAEIQLFIAVLGFFVPNPPQLVHIYVAFHAMLNSACPLVIAKALLVSKVRKPLSQHRDILLLEVDKSQQLAAQIRQCIALLLLKSNFMPHLTSRAPLLLLDR